MNMLNVDDVKWVEDKVEDVKKLSVKVEANMPSEEIKIEENQKTDTKLSKMKAFVKKAVDCCIE